MTESDARKGVPTTEKQNHHSKERNIARNHIKIQLINKDTIADNMALVTTPHMGQRTSPLDHGKPEISPGQAINVSSTFAQMVKFVCGGKHVTIWI